VHYSGSSRRSLHLSMNARSPSLVVALAQCGDPGLAKLHIDSSLRLEQVPLAVADGYL
jgi:hypothetical protein